MQRDRGVRLTILWFDVDVMELRAFASNGAFTGTAHVYAGHGQLGAWADALNGFPSSPHDRRTVDLGTFDPDLAGGGVELDFRVADACGHLNVHVRIQEDRDSDAGPAAASFAIPAEPAAVDEFVDALRKIPLEVGAQLRLRAA